MRFYIRIFLLVFFLIIIGCQKNRTIHFYSKDKAQCITVIDKGDYRFIMDGKHSSISSDNLVKLSTKNVDDISDVLYICWKNQIYEWEIVSNKSEAIENNLDNKKFVIKTSLPMDDRNIPTESKFRKDNCAIFYYYLDRLTPDKGATVEIVNY